MRKFILPCTLVCGMVLLMSASPVRAQAHVASYGDDTNCDPCRTFQGAINKFPGLPAIQCLNSGSYGPFTVTTSIIIDCTGHSAIVAQAAGNGITINAPAGARIILRNLIIQGGWGQAVSNHGISTTAIPNGKLIVENCVISGFGGGYGINFVPGGPRGTLQVTNSLISNNAHGIVLTPPAGQIASLILNQVELTANSNVGLLLTGAGVAAGTMRHSVVGSNGLDGVFANAGQAYFTIESSSIVANLNTGIRITSAGSVLNVAASTIGGNGTGVGADAGQLISFGNNQISANGTNGSFTSTTPLR